MAKTACKFLYLSGSTILYLWLLCALMVVVPLV